MFAEADETMAPLSNEPLHTSSVPAIHADAPKGLPQQTTDAVEAFSCIAERCEDTCCRDWAVLLDKRSLDRMKAHLSHTPEGRDRLVHLVVIGRPTHHAGGQIQIQMNEQGACPLLETDNHCGVQKEFGEQALSTTCSVFPRTAVAVAGRLEVNASLACPEIARKVLLGDQPQRLRAAAKPMLARPYVGKTVGGDPDDAYASEFLRVRATLQRIFRRTEYPIATRLVAAAHFADRVRGFFFAGTSAFAGADEPAARAQLERAMEEADAAATLKELHHDLGAVAESAGQAAAGFVATFLLERERLPHGPRFTDMLRASFQSIARAAELPAGAPMTSPVIWQVLQQRRARLDERMGARVAQVMDNYVDHFLLRHPYTDSTTLLEYLYKLGLNLAVVKFLTLTSPDVAALLARPADAEADRTAYDRAAVHVTQTFTKAIGHQLDYLDVTFRALAGSGGFGFGRFVPLGKLV